MFGQYKRDHKSVDDESLLIKRRKKYLVESKFLDEDDFRRVFQLSDKVYSQFSGPLDNKKVFLHCDQVEGMGDVSQTFFLSEILKKKRPELQINIGIGLGTVERKKIEELFPVNQYTMHYFGKYDDYYEKGARLTALVNQGCAVGIARSLANVYNTHHRTIREYGFSREMDVHNEVISMGIGRNEEGVSLPVIKKRELEDIKTPWLRENLNPKAQLYHLYQHTTTQQILSLYTLSSLNKDQIDPLLIIMPMAYSLRELIEWKILDLDYLKNAGIGKITRVTPQGSETIAINDNGKEIKILSGGIPKDEMEILQQHSKPLFGCTGDMTFSESVVLNKIPMYEILSWKVNFFRSLIEFANEQKFELLAKYFQKLLDVYIKQTEIINRNRPKGVGHFGLDMAASMDTEQYRMSHAAPELDPLLKQWSNEILVLVKDPQLQQEAEKFNQLIRDNYNIETRFLQTVDRGVVLANYPELIAVEKALWERFKKKEITLDEACTELSAQLSKVAEMKPEGGTMKP